MRRSILILIVLLGAALSVSAQDRPQDKDAGVKYVVFFDLQKPAEGIAARPRVFTFAYDAALVKDFRDGKAIWNEDPDDDTPSFGTALGAASRDTRCLCTKGDKILILAYVDTKDRLKALRMEIVEKNRLSRLSKDIVTLLRIAGALAEGARAAGEIPRYERTYQLQRTRAELTITPHFVGSENKQPSVTVITGPREALFLSADVPLTKASDLDVNEGGTGLQLRENPASFYAGVNYTLGDVLSQPSGFWSHVVFKGMVKASKEPWDSYGWAIAFRDIEVPYLGIRLDTITPFAGYTYSRLKDATGKPAGRDSELRFGVSLNLDSALDFIKDKEEKK